MSGWRDQAACAGMPVDMFFVDRGGSNTPARKVCSRCPVIDECLDETLEIEAPNARYGIFGGLDGSERETLAALRAAI